MNFLRKPSNLLAWASTLPWRPRPVWGEGGGKAFINHYLTDQIFQSSSSLFEKEKMRGNVIIGWFCRTNWIVWDIWGFRMDKFAA